MNRRRFLIGRVLPRLLFGALFVVASYFVVKYGRLVAATSIHDNNFHATAQLIIIAASGWIGMILAAVGMLSTWRRSRIFIPRRAYLLAMILLVPLMAYLWSFTVQYSLKRYAVSGDEVSMIFQAEVFSRGMLWNKTMDSAIAPHFKRHHVITTPEREYSKYPPGLPLVMALFKKTVGIEWTNVGITLITFFLLFFVVSRISGSRVTALFTGLLFAVTTSVVFHASSYFSHPVVMLFVLLTVAILFLAGTQADERHRRPFFIAAGAAIGLILFFRTWDAVIIAAAVGLFLTRELFFPPAGQKNVPLKQRFYAFARIVGLVSVGCIPVILLFLLYQKIYTGEFFTSPYQLIYYKPQLLTGQRIGEIHADMSDYYSKGLLGLTPNWLNSQAQWTNKYLIWLLLALPFIKLGRLRRYEWLVVFLPICYVLGYAIHNAGGGDSFGARYYYPALWCWFYGAAETAHFIGRRLWRFIHWVPYAAFLYTLFIYSQEDFPGKETGIMRGVNKRFALYGQVEARVPQDEKVIVLIKHPPAMNESFFTRHSLDLSDRILYGQYVSKPRMVDDLKEKFPDRKIYVYDWDKYKRKVRFYEIGGSANEEAMEDTDR
ncbi:MAG TPA: hypothetical protein PLV42_05020 [bacterium]|nr:hypothetical protein [bacterium]